MDETFIRDLHMKINMQKLKILVSGRENKTKSK